MGVGLYFIYIYMKKPPTRKIEAAIQTVGTLTDIKKQSLVNKMTGKLGKSIAKHVSLSEEKRFELDSALKYLRYNVTPEEHKADALSAALIVVILFLAFIPIMPLLSAVGVVIGFLLYYMEFNRPLREMDKIKDDIEMDSALFCKFISDSLGDGNRNVVDILTTSRSSLSNSFKKELETTITDLKTGNQEEALVAMSKRIPTATMSQIVVGLIGVLRGNEEKLYFDLLYDKLYKNELSMIKKKNSRKPDKVSKISMLLLLAVLAQILVGMMLNIMEKLEGTGILF